MPSHIVREIERTRYLRKLDGWKDRTDMIKVIIGVRRAGKSVVMRQFVRRIQSSEVDRNNILYMDFESSEFYEVDDFKDLIRYIDNRVPRDERTYIFLDEIQRVRDWERAVNSLMVDFDADIYITGSNAHLLSSELSTYLSGRYVTMPVLPFSFSEFLQRFPPTPEVDRNTRFHQYLRIGGMPLIYPDIPEENNRMILEGIYNTVLVKDTATRMGVRDLEGLDRVARFLMDNTGNVTNVDNIARSADIDKKTVSRYIRSLTEAFLFYRADRYDVVRKKLLNSHEKYYPVDTGLARAILGRGDPDISKPLENIVFLELIRRGYHVRVGSFKDREIDFTANKNGNIEYFQVSMTMLNDDTYQREVRSLKAIDDNYPKTILSLDSVLRDLPDGLIHRNIIEWLLDDSD